MRKIVLALALSSLSMLASSKVLNVYESPTCGCCDLWADYMKVKGYQVQVHKSDDFLKVKEKMNIQPMYQSCHTGVIEGYAIEGHVPEDAVAWLLKNKPQDVIGVSAPGMPQGSPGMEQGYEEEYPVVLMLKNGDYRIYGIYKGHQLIK
ncbi:hypothetical protein (DUF411 domain) [Campylobacter subantarcticus LMG 24377]|uniref:DUF411 domain-containing protein n=2 Tax=Campylobacter subantarcticus TaxID=497724 RepID=A0A0A8H8G3_9BACT|nr:DUF411 domain-containing protein [Campylobacter subantarcticus]EAJ1261593.1 DUF411 domain-containing protein [Campylobacter lari]AJC90371.1 hypothetical protein (DUF411 domain) [Campylobacter subantarcticus LMG 24374]AJC92033.1 hypothetical protein (DUF411 domain) [Campylobacter subantarcticus LMG 24377]EAL3939620.1 DUF411 domain-containing protein [Campylobacter lari]MPB99297.1 DUF411 domain-containing protein [Campylobacter subantarcticus]